MALTNEAKFVRCIEYARDLDVEDLKELIESFQAAIEIKEQQQEQ